MFKIIHEKGAEFTVRGMLQEQSQKIGTFHTNTKITLSEEVNIFTKSTGYSCIYPRYDPVLTDMKLTDPDALRASMSLLALDHLNEMTGLRVQPPPLPETRLTYKYQTELGLRVGTLERSCTACRWHKLIRMGSDEIGFDFSREDGPSLRDRAKDMYSSAYQSCHACTLFGTFLEEQFQLLEELNVLAESGVRNSSSVNIRAGYDSWPLDRFRQKRPMSLDPDDRPGDAAIACDPTGEWASMHWLVNNMLDGKHCEFHRERSQWRQEEIPTGWLPRVDDGVLATGGIIIHRGEWM